MTKFQTAPGLPGYGTKGRDGSTGLPGISFYFSSLDGASESTLTRARISGNLNLYDGLPLPSGRTYLIGDFFVDKNGYMYAIQNPSIGTYSTSIGQINTTGLFTPSVVSGIYERWANLFTSPKYIIDDVFVNTSESNYTTKFESYGMVANKFAKIQYSNIAQGIYTPFTAWYQGANFDAGIALVRQNATNLFRLGNLNSTGRTGNVSLALDFKNVIISNKANDASINPSAALGSILTNAELNSPYLFSPNFNGSPTSFVVESSGNTNIRISWDKRDFLRSTNLSQINPIRADIHFFYAPTTTYNTKYVIYSDTSALNNYKPLILPNIDVSGTLVIAGLTAATNYNCYINFYENGWNRVSETKSALTGVTPVIETIPSTLTQFSADGESKNIDVSSNVPWNITTSPSAPWLTFNPVSGLPNSPTPTTVTINASTNTDASTRNTTLEIRQGSSGGAILKTIDVTQAMAAPITLTFGSAVIYSTGDTMQVNSSLNSVSNLPSGCTVTVEFGYTLALSGIGFGTATINATGLGTRSKAILGTDVSTWTLSGITGLSTVQLTSTTEAVGYWPDCMSVQVTPAIISATSSCGKPVVIDGSILVATAYDCGTP